MKPKPAEFMGILPLASSPSELHGALTPRLHANMELLMISSTPDLESSSLSHVHNLYKLCMAVQ